MFLSCTWTAFGSSLRASGIETKKNRKNGREKGVMGGGNSMMVVHEFNPSTQQADLSKFKAI